MSFTTAPRRRLVLLLVAVLAATLGGLLTHTATAGSAAPSTGNSPTDIVIDRVYSNVPVPSGLPTGAQPYVVVKKGDSFVVEVSFTDAKGRSTFFDVPTILSMSLKSSSTVPPGPVLILGNVTVAKGQRTAVLTGSIADAMNQVVLTVKTVGDPALTPALTTDSGLGQRFDVLSTYNSATPAAEQGIGGSDEKCASATAVAPVCGTLLLPNGAASSQVFMSLGPCDSTAYTNCGNRLGGSIVQVLADLTAPSTANPGQEIDLYTKTSPATLILRCDTSLCGTAAIKGIPVNFTLSGNGDLGPAPACPRKGTVGRSQDLCVDYVQSKRDGASDTILYLLFTRDLRGGIG